MKPIERIAMYLKFRNINPYSFEKKIKLSNGYFSKQLRHLGYSYASKNVGKKI